MPPNAGFGGQRLRRSRAGAFCRKWHDNEKESRQSRRCRLYKPLAFERQLPHLRRGLEDQVRALPS